MKRKLCRILFIFITFFLSAALLADTSEAVTAQSNYPKSIICTFGEDAKTGRNFTWVSSTQVNGGEIEYCPKYEFQGFGESNIIKAAAHSYEVKTDSGKRLIHKVELTGLRPGTEYVYRVVNSSYCSKQGAFKTEEESTGAFTFINITDTQGSTSGDYVKWKNILDKALENFPDARFLVHTGDMVDAGQKIGQWDMFTRAAENELMNITIVPAVGNHEALNSNGTNYNMKNFVNYFDTPVEKDTGAPKGTVYSFDYGEAHVAVMNTQCGRVNLKKQAEWLKNDVMSSHKTWNIVALHRGPYGATYDTTDIRQAWTPVFDELGIDLVLQGHDHNYVRSYPMKNGKAVKQGSGTVYMVSDAGGVKFYPRKARTWQAVDLQPKTQMYIAVTVDGKKLAIKAYNSKNVLLDAITLYK